MSRAFEDLARNIITSDALNTHYLDSDKGLKGSFNPRDGRSVTAVNMLEQAARAEIRDKRDGNKDLFDQVFTDIKKERTQAKYRARKKSDESKAIATKLGGRVRKRNWLARKKGLVADPTLEQAEKILKSANGKCANCGKRVVWYKMELAHIVHEKNGGGSTESNTRPLCRPCNRNQGATA